MTPDSDDELVALAVRGDVRAFERLVERHRDVVYRVVSRVADDADADDVVQDTFLRAYHRLERYRGRGSFRGWLLQIAHNSALSAATGRRPHTVPLTSVEDEPIAAEAGTPVSQVEGRERRRRLERKVKGLSPTHRTVLVLRDVEGLSYDEIAVVMDSPLGSVKARLHRARGELIDVLRHNTYDWELPDER